jgi:hypothetical protein
VPEVFVFVKQNLSGARRRKGAGSGERGTGKGRHVLCPRLSPKKPRRALARRLLTTFLGEISVGVRHAGSEAGKLCQWQVLYCMPDESALPCKIAVMGTLRRALRQVVNQLSLSFEKAYVWIDERKSRKKIYRMIMLLIAFSLLSWYLVLFGKFMWEYWRSHRIPWQMLWWIPLGGVGEFFVHLANLFGPDDRRDPPYDPTYPWPHSPEDNRAEPVLMFECTLDGRLSRVAPGDNDR